MFLTMESARLPCWTTFSRLSFSKRVNSSTSSRIFLSSSAGLSTSLSSSVSSAETAEKLLTKLSGFLISCAMPAVLAERGEFLGLYQAILRGAQVLQRSGQVVRALA